MTHICNKIGLCYVTAKILQCGRISKGTVECAVEKDFRKKNARPPIPQERTKTQHCTKVADTIKK